jgi:thymidylate kinase
MSMTNGPQHLLGTVASSRDIHPVLRATFAALDSAGIEWALLRGSDDLAAPDGDVDLIVHPAQTRRLSTALMAAGFARMPSWGYGSHTFFVAYDEATDHFLKLDVVSELAFGPGFTLPTPCAADCVTHRRRGGDGVWQLADEDTFWSLLLHKLLDKGNLTQDVAVELRDLAQAPLQDSSLAAFLGAIGVDTGELAALARAGDRSGLEGAAGQLQAAWRRRRPVIVAARRAQHRFWKAAGKPLRRVRRRGLTVAVLGPDGAGKSTAADGLREHFYFPAQTMYMGPGQPHGGSRTPPPGIGLALRIAGQQRRWLHARGQASRGRLVVFDRYSLDALLPPRRPLSRARRLRRLLLANAVPRPQLTVVLDAPGALLFARKGEQTPEILETERQAYRALAGRLRHAIVVDATQDADAVRRAVTAAVWQRWTRNWRG